MKQKGFSLIEMLIYAMLLAFISILAFSWLSNSVQTITQTSKKSNQVMIAHAALQRMSADIQMADVPEKFWKSDEQSLHFQHNNKRISWLLQSDKLYRIEGRSKALIATGLHNFTHQLQQDGERVEGVNIALEFADMNFEKEIRVYNG